MTTFQQQLEQAAQQLAAHDPVLRPIIARAGLSTIEPHQDYYRALVHEVIGQQLHTKAAASIRQRFEALFDSRVPEPTVILARPFEDLRSVGLSRAKATYIRDIAQHIVDGKLAFGALDSLSNEQVIARLTAVKGIGEWTAHMFLIFCMGRLDVLPTGDLGIRSGIRKLYGLRDLPTAAQMIQLAKRRHWSPYQSVASWYIWYALDNTPTV